MDRNMKRESMDRETRELLAKLFTSQLRQLAEEKDIDCGENPDRIDFLSTMGKSDDISREDIEQFIGQAGEEEEEPVSREGVRGDIYLGEVEKVLKDFKNKGAIFAKANERLNSMQGNFQEGNFGGTISLGIKSSGLINDISERYENVRRAFIIISFRQLLADVKESGIDIGEAESLVASASESFHNHETEDLDGILQEIAEKSEFLQKEQLKNIKDAIYAVEEFIAQARELGADVKKARDLLRNAEDAFDAKKFKKVHQFLDKARQAAEEARRDRIQGLSDSLLFVKTILDDARDIGADVSEADELYTKAKAAFDEEDYGECKVLVKEVEQLALKLQDNQIKKAMNLRLRREGAGTDIGEEVVEVEPEAAAAPPRARGIPRYRRPTMPGYPQDAYQPTQRPTAAMPPQERMRKTKCPNCGQRFPVQGGAGPIRVECPYCGMRGMMP
jgi:DNA-directed RNA polymerase subunit RPC12/RpoP